MKSPIINKNIRAKKLESANAIDDNIITTENTMYSSSDIHGSRVVINPAVLRYLEQNRSINYSTLTNKTHQKNHEYFSNDALININDEKDEYLLDDIFNNCDTQPSFLKTNFSNSELFELHHLRHNDILLDFSTYSTDFLASAQLAHWILTRN